MKYLALAVSLGLALAIANAQAWGEETNMGAADRAPALGTPTTTFATESTTTSCADDSWRYQCFEGRWWYWLPANRWVYYDQGRWNDYTLGAATVARSEGPIRYETGYRGPMESNTNVRPQSDYYYSPRVQTYRSAPADQSWTSFGTHGRAISFGF